MTTVKTFRSTDPGAIALSGTAGSLIALLDAYLVTGHAVAAPTSITVTAGIATLNYATAHGFAPESIALIDGATPGGLNGEKRIIATPTANTATFAAPGIADGAATGTLSSRLAPAGWTKDFSGTNLAVFRSPSVLGTRMFLRVDDTGTTAARVVGYETMSAVSAGAGPFPTAAQMSGGGYWLKSDAANATARPWVLVADSRGFHLHLVPYGAGFGGVTFGFGDGLPSRPGGDPYAVFLASSFQVVLSLMWAGALDAPIHPYVAMPRNFTGLGSSVLHAAQPYTGNGGAVSGADGTLGAFPSLIDGGLRLSPKFLTQDGPPRCDVPGIYHVPQSGVFSTFKRGDIIAGTGPLAGRRLMALNPSNAINTTSTTANTGTSFVDITGPWR